MENHPIPQDITGFQFKLIGRMTVRQFVYLATGVIIAWIFYVLPLPFIIRLPFIILFVSTGAALAFVPVSGRPMDTMVMNFIRALFAPTQYVYQKQGGDLTQAVPASAQTAPPQPSVVNIAAPTVQAVPVQNIQTPPLPSGVIQLAQDIPLAPLPPLNLDEEVSDEKKIAESEKKAEEEAENLKKELEEAKKAELQTAPADQPVVHQKAEELEKMLEQTMKQKEELEKELLILKSKLDSQKQEKFTPSMATPAVPMKQTPNVRQVPPAMIKEAGIPGLPQEPNLITGVIKDPRGNPIQNILVEVKDQEDNPVRAFKTNGLGQFASATSLSNGKYSITFEDSDGKNKFDAVEIEATGAPIMPLEIISVDPREELRRELFN